MVTIFFISLVVSILLTPGPTNTLLAASGVQVGFRRSLALIPAESMGYVIAITVWGIGIDWMAHYVPSLPSVLKLFSAAFMLYLAVRLWRTAKMDLTLDWPSVHPRVLFLATLLNPKALLFASAIFPVAAWQQAPVYVMHMLCFILLIIPIALFWIFVGALMISRRITWLNQSNLQRVASCVLLLFSLPIAYSAITGF